LPGWSLYRPDDDLFLKFAEVRDREDVVAFAQEYGFLGILENEVDMVLREEEGEGEEGGPGGESTRQRAPDLYQRLYAGQRDDPIIWEHLHGVWFKQTYAMRKVFQLWELSDDGSKLHHLPETLRRLRLGPKNTLLERADDERLQAVLESVVSGIISPFLADSQHLELTTDLNLVPQPRHLSGFLWLKLAQTIQRRRPIRRCAAEDCQAWFLGGGRGYEKRHCSTACRVRRHDHAENNRDTFRMRRAAIDRKFRDEEFGFLPEQVAEKPTVYRPRKRSQGSANTTERENL